MRKIAGWMVGLALSGSAWAAPNHVVVHQDEGGFQLLVDGEPTFVRGMNWSYVPIGQNYSYVLWDQPDDYIEAALRREMDLLKASGANSIRQYPGIPPRWVQWIWEQYGISTVINPLMGRYGVTVNGRFVAKTDYADPATRAAIKAEALAAVERYRDTPGVLMWLLGNENNYGLEWSGFEIQDLPVEQRDEARARALYSLMGEVTDAVHAADSHHPVAIANGDMHYLELIAEECPNLDIFGANVYRGASARDAYQVVNDTLHLPLLFSEFGSDAYDAKAGREDGQMQARYLARQWEDIYRNTDGRGVGNGLGGYVFQWSDGWWKHKQEENLDVHDTTASWATNAYSEDFVDGRDNMNEEWFGITAKGPPDANGFFELYPRAGYFTLREAWRLDPYDPDLSAAQLDAHFAAIDPTRFEDAYDQALTRGRVAELSRAYLSNVRVEMDTFTTTTDRAAGEGRARFAFDHQASFYVDAEAHPSDDVRAELSVNLLGHAPTNRIDRITYETRGRDLVGVDAAGNQVDLAALERVKVYRAAFTWEHELFTLNGYYREPHFHWGYEGDLFGFYREAHYGPNPDTYNADVPIGVELTGKGGLEGLRLAFGPEVYWGANPTLIGLYAHKVGRTRLALAHQEDIAPQSVVKSSFAVPERVTRKTALSAEWTSKAVTWELGGLMAGTERVGESFTRVVEAADGPSYLDSGVHVLDDTIAMADTLGARTRFTAQQGRFHLLVDGAYKGLVSDGGVDATQIFTGWSLRPSQRGNQVGGSAGVALSLGTLQIAPNVLVQKPLVGPLSPIAERWDASTGWYYTGVTPRNVLDDPFAVLENRETTGLELLLAYDPTPGSWMWAWDNEEREDAAFAGSLDFSYRMQPTSRDSNLGFLQDGTLFSYDAAPPAQDVWEVQAKAILNPRGDLKLLLGAYGGTAQARGSDPRLLLRSGGDVRVRYRSLAWDTALKLNDWGPYDFHQDFNLTYPVQLSTDLSGGLAAPRLGETSTRLGLSSKYRTLDEHSEGWFARPGAPDFRGYELELGTYIHLSL